MEAFNLFADDVLAGQRAVRRYETSFVKRRLKASLALPLEQLARVSAHHSRKVFAIFQTGGGGPVA
jgi:hypothetical protein